MLKKFFEEWNAALKNETIKKTQYDDNNNILWQTGEVAFRDTVIQIHRKSNGDGKERKGFSKTRIKKSLCRC